ncbi:LTA synthase family protein [Paenibacillus sp. J5C_2022]|uniref:LTA synthase family protein n=1 Tax=Paenibacillus sp. J5C2022 TaxID=2977129 RepID=UPI0021D2AB77|nr:LTA synthase family protein [Paenibacillus sp. J5C2022]MCU6707586.1 LTA synthase family protein [Paenibacillus sp. J5C2022]
MKQERTGFGPVRRCLCWSLHQLDRLIVLDTLLFATIMVWKLYHFSRLLSVPYMDMTRTDAFIETGAVLLIASWTLLLPTRGRLLSLIGLNALLSALLYADVIYYRYFQDLITVPVLAQLSQVDSLGDSIKTLLGWNDFLLLADIPLLLLFGAYVLFRGGADLRQQRSGVGSIGVGTPGTEPSIAGSIGGAAPANAVRWRTILFRIGAGAAVFALGFSLFFGHVNRAAETWAKDLFKKDWWNLSLYNVVGGLGFHGYDLYRYAKLNWLDAETVTAMERDETEAWIMERSDRRVQLEDDPLFGAYEGSNLLMVQVEALQSFMLGKTIGGQEITPVLNDLLKNSADFSSFYHQTAQGRTSDADFAANCSLQPVMSGSVFIQYASNDFHCLPGMLKDNGYSAAVFHPYQGGFWNRNVMYNRMNYDQFYSLKHFRMDEPVGWALGDKSFYRQSMDVIEDMPQPFYGFLITLTSHHPYRMPAAEKRLDVEELEGTIMGDYLHSIHYADAALGGLIQRLKADGLWDRTILAIYGDHDNSITDWKLYDRFMNDTESELEQEQMLKRIPLIIRLPGDAEAGTYTAVGGQLDIAPTLLHLLGISSRDTGMIGMPLLTKQPPGERFVAQRYGSWTDGKRYYLPSADGLAAGSRCYAVHSGDLLEPQACEPGTAVAEQQLMMSDRIVMNNLIAKLFADTVLEAKGQ